MVKIFFKTAFRHLVHKKSHALISVTGLAIGLAVCTLLFLYIQNELSYDCFHDKADHIYRLCQSEHPFQAPQVAKLLADNLPEIKNCVRILVSGEGVVQYQNNRFKEKDLAFADASLFQIFSFPFKAGRPAEALAKPFTIVISEQAAAKYFGRENPMGKALKVDNQEFTITGVMANMPLNSHFRYEMLLSLAGADSMFGAKMMTAWGWQNFLVYFYIPGPFSPAEFAKKCTQVVLAHCRLSPGEEQPRFSIQKIKDIHLYSAHFANDIQPQNSITYLMIFAAIGFLILIVACFNYINIMTANATTRLTEIGIRKVVGASRLHLSLQFFGESLSVISLALPLSLLFVVLGLPAFNGLAGKQLAFGDLTSLPGIVGVLGLAGLTTLLAGLYPCLHLSALQPARMFKAATRMGESRLKFRKALLILQFVIVAILISSAVAMFSQMRYLQNKQLGFKKESVLVAEAQDSFKETGKYQAFKQAMLQDSAVKSVSCASRIPSCDLTDFGAVALPGKAGEVKLPFVHVGQDFFDTLGLEAVQGRLFSEDVTTDAERAVVLNEAAVKKLGLADSAVGQQLTINWPASTREIVGIVKDCHFESLRKPIQPTVFVISHEDCYRLLVKIDPANVPATRVKLQAIARQFYPDQIIDFHLLDAQLHGLYQSDRDTLTLMGYLAGLAILIACIGLFGLAAFMMRSRTKEIGVRKVLGASTARILLLLTKDVAYWVVAANLVAWPVAFYGIDRWLQNFSYRMDPTLWPFLLAGGATLLMAQLTVTWQALRAARANPAKSLKCE